MKKDQKMLFIKNIDDLENENPDFNTTEYEVLTDSFTVGQLTFGPYFFTIWEFGMKREGEKRKLCLRIKEINQFSNDIVNVTNKNGFYHGGGIAEELVALSSLALHGRYILGPIVRENDMPRMYSTNSGRIDNSLVIGRKNLGELSQFFELVKGLNVEYHLKFILAVRLYHQALLVIENQPDIAYLNFVSAIETLCQDDSIEEVTLSQIDERLSSLVESIEDDTLRNKISKAIIKKERFLNRKFVSFIMKYTDESFWERPDRPEHGRIDPQYFENILKRIYGERSKYLHTGEPFQKTIFFPPSLNEEMPLGLATMVRGKRWEIKDYIPHPHFFEKLVNHVLVNFLKRNQV